MRRDEQIIESQKKRTFFLPSLGDLGNSKECLPSLEEKISFVYIVILG